MILVFEVSIVDTLLYVYQDFTINLLCLVSIVSTLLGAESTLFAPNRFYFDPEILLEKVYFEVGYLY